MNNPKTDILVAQRLVFSRESIIVKVVIVVGIVRVGLRVWVFIDRIIVLDIIRALVFAVPAIVLRCLFRTRSLPLRRINQLGRSVASVDQEEHNRRKCQTLIFSREYRCISSPVVGEEEDKIVCPKYWLSRFLSSQVEFVRAS